MSDTPKQSNEQRYYDFLRHIAKDYDASEKLMRSAERRYALDPCEVLGMAYDNIQQTAKDAIRGKRRPKS